MKNKTQNWLTLFNNVIEKNINNPYFIIPHLFEEMSINQAELYLMVKRHTGMSPKKYIKVQRLKKAKKLLEQKSCSTVVEVAKSVGYSNPTSFSVSYKREYGILPSKYF